MAVSLGQVEGEESKRDGYPEVRSMSILSYFKTSSFRNLKFDHVDNDNWMRWNCKTRIRDCFSVRG